MHYFLGIFKVTSENYDTLKTALKELIEELSKIKEITIDEKVFKIEFTSHFLEVYRCLIKWGTFKTLFKILFHLFLGHNLGHQL